MQKRPSDVSMTIRISSELKTAFQNVCEERNQSASKVIKSFIEDYVAKAQASKS